MIFILINYLKVHCYKSRIYVTSVFLFLIMLSAFSGNSLPSENRSSDIKAFFRETDTEYIFSNTFSKLVIEKSTWKMKLYDPEVMEHYSDYSPPAFFSDDRWITVEGYSTAEQLNENNYLISISGTNHMNFSISVKSISEYGFNTVIRSSIPDVVKVRGTIRLNPVEEIYGFGEMWNGSVHQRGKSFDLWVKGGTPDECVYMPYFVSTNNYCFYLNYGGLVSFDVGQRKADELVYVATTDVIDFTLISGESISTAVRNFLSITGMPAKPPRWAYKPWFWLMGDPDIPGGNLSTLKGEHFVKMINKLHDLNIPVGATWMEPPWQDARNTFIPDKEFSPDLKGLIREISDMDVHTLAWAVPYTLPDASNWREAVENGYLVRKPKKDTSEGDYTITETGELDGNFYTYIDFFNPEAVRWWQYQIERSLDLGLKGFKLDDGQHLPPDAVLFGGKIGKDYRNSYGLEYHKVFYETLNRRYGDDFLMIPRAAWIGSASYTNFKWPGDLSGSFANNGLPSSVYSSLSLAFSGIPFVSTDIGGFVNKPSPENVWIRWAQFGAFLPGMQTLHMPWWYSEKAINHFRWLTWLHTDLTPYWMSLANETHETGAPICRPLVWNYQHDMDSWRIDDQFTVGDYLMVAPFMNPNSERQVYIPEGTWMEFQNEKISHTGPKTIRWFKGYGETGLYSLPLFVKEGAIIPMEIVNNVTGLGWEGSMDFITLCIWPEYMSENEFHLRDMEDVRINTNWNSDTKIEISWSESTLDYILRVYFVRGNIPIRIYSEKTLLHLFPDLGSFKQSTADGWFYDTETHELWVRKKRSNANEIAIHLR